MNKAIIPDLPFNSKRIKRPPYGNWEFYSDDNGDRN